MQNWNFHENAMGGHGDVKGGAGDHKEIEKTKVIVNYIPQFATEDDLAQIFTPVGKVESIKIMRDHNTGYSFGFGFVKYFTAEDAAKAIQQINGLHYMNKRLKVSYSRLPGGDMRASNLYITNLPKNITEQEVHNLFCQYGEILQTAVLKHKITGMPRGVAFVRFSKSEEAQAAITHLNGKLLDKAVLPLIVRVAENHSRRKAQDLHKNLGMSVHPHMGFEQVGEADPFRTMTLPATSNQFQNYPMSNVGNMGAGDNNHFQNPFFG